MVVATAVNAMLERCSRVATLSFMLNNVSKIKLKLCLFLINYALRHGDVCGSGRIYPRFLDLGTSWGGEWPASCPYRFTPGGKSPHHQLYRSLGGLQSWSGRSAEVRIQSLYQLRYRGSLFYNLNIFFLIFSYCRYIVKKSNFISGKEHVLLNLYWG
jgi:hypothetical protein